MEPINEWGRKDGKREGSTESRILCPLAFHGKGRRQKLLNDKVLAIILMKTREMGDFFKDLLACKM